MSWFAGDVRNLQIVNNINNVISRHKAIEMHIKGMFFDDEDLAMFVQVN